MHAIIQTNKNTAITGIAYASLFSSIVSIITGLTYIPIAIQYYIQYLNDSSIVNNTACDLPIESLESDSKSASPHALF